MREEGMRKPKAEDYLPKQDPDSEPTTINFRVNTGFKREFEAALKSLGIESATDFFKGQMQWIIDRAKAEKRRS